MVYQDGPLGVGWTHNWVQTATAGSDLLRSMGSQLAIEATVTVAALFVVMDLAADTTQPVDKLAITELSMNWWNDQISGNTVTVSLPDQDLVFVKLANGTYVNPMMPLNLSKTETEPLPTQRLSRRSGILTPVAIFQRGYFPSESLLLSVTLAGF